MKNKVWRFSLGVLLLFYCLSAVFVVRQVVSRLGAELQKVYTSDTPIYFAVGRGLLNGIKPYTGMFETKPPGIFFLTAASLSVNGDTDLCNALCFLCLSVIGVVPIVLSALLMKKKKVSLFLKCLLSVSAGFVGILIMLYAQLRSGHIQVEAFGSSFMILYLLMIILMKDDKMKANSLGCFFAAVFFMLAVMFKEPFLLVGIASALLFVRSSRDFMYRLLLPLCYGGIMGVLLLACTGTLKGYLVDYLPYMTGGHVSIYGSPFRRAIQIDYLLRDSSEFSVLLPGILLVMFLLVISIQFYQSGEIAQDRKHASAWIVFSMLKVPAALYLVSFSVGLGGQYYNHHYVFAVPFYIALLFYIVKTCADCFDDEESKGQMEQKFFIKPALLCAVCLLAVLACLDGLMLPSYQPDETMLADNSRMRVEAAYVDELLDSLGEDRYQFLGFNGDCFYGLTEHSPLGPVFFQDPHTLSTEDTWFASRLREQMEQADVLIVQRVEAGAMTDYINQVLAEDFTNELPQGVPVPPNVFGYGIYIRKN